jgi:hypothetical protein
VGISTRQVDNVDTLPPGSQVGEVAPWVQGHLGWKEILAIGAVVFALIAFVWWIISRDIRSWVSYGGGWWVPGTVAVLGIIFIVSVAARFVVLVNLRGYKVPFWQVGKVIPQLIEVDEAFASTAGRMVRAQTISYPQKFELPALPEPAQLEDEGPQLIPDSEWLPWITELPHTMIAGATKSGKTTLARVELFERLTQGYAGIVCDPKGKEWYGLPVVGGGREFTAILTTLDQIHDEMAQRFRAYAEGERNFQPIKVLVDEVPDIMDACLDMRRRLVDGRWSHFVRQLGSLAREIGISVTLMTQSPLVEDIGMNSAMRKNFSRVALGDEAPILIREERDGKRRAQLQALIRGQQFPAAMIHRGQVHLLDTSNVVQLSQRHVARPLGWDGAKPPLIARPVVSASAVQSGVVRASVPTLDAGAIIYPPYVKTPNGKIAFLLSSGYTYRQIERELSVSHATISQVSRALKIQKGATS